MTLSSDMDKLVLSDQQKLTFTKSMWTLDATLSAKMIANIDGWWEKEWEYVLLSSHVYYNDYKY